ncbi:MULTISPECIES: efflux RND transporter periplasmic adaptor subunit [Vibrio]|uniref:Efflux RND transporter periplasmic adaptor subunit n=1 Tax=Vibrio mediterranei TaxID=689 RepID=A0A2C9PCL0_9VIBR|nr:MULTISPECIES: efflux RND transporter periplasmic adaptor subunit [Vibrio]ASI90569.1 efflux transporter periplasmic adaptor subunit [Vibrio mediterranei]AYV22593.1 efflux RND transporter periplasmic adaptor subunit [Vibrio mediterranei]EDL52233.1 membrane-fusion protein [Vibrio mediterranei AK1]MCG9626140.1 efflux RND transporter periplasmic adaptor subunit [Vibrio mediterranei]MCG9658241.1 efflux RND transporter periplasmic adaptor subunit [Vibrio mediterranei]
MKSKLSFLAIVASLISGCGQEPPPIPEPDSRPAKLFNVAVGNSKFERTFPATSEAGDKAVLAFRVPGQLEQIVVRAGQPVSKGQLLAQLNPDEYQLLEKQAKANFQLADVQYQRALKLRKDKVVSEQDFDQAKANMNSAQANWSQAKANLRYTKLLAPYDGTISIIPADNYEYIQAKEGVMNIQSNQLIKVIFQLPDLLLNRFQSKNQVDASMVFDAYPSRAFELTFQEIDTEADPKTGSYKVTMIMERPTDVGILPGMAGQVSVVTRSTGATVIPQSALFMEGDTKCVWRVSEQGIVEKVAVELNDKRQVISGLNDGDQIVVSGVQGIESGIKVREWVKERGL